MKGKGHQRKQNTETRRQIKLNQKGGREKTSEVSM